MAIANWQMTLMPGWNAPNDADTVIYDTLEQVCELINQQPQTGWIPVNSGKRPKDRQKVLCSCKRGELHILKWNEINRLWIGHFPHEFLEGYVLAWQPLPQPFKESEEE